MFLLFNTRSITFAVLVELIMRCIKKTIVHPRHVMYEDFHKPRKQSVIIEKIQKRTKELHPETLIRKLHFKGSWQIHGQPQGVFIRVLQSNQVKRSRR